ncbi:MAG: 2Fe-2S iron-sulfur cluster binding domain-containing protein [Rhodoferax sp.]|jgi:ferredoxin|nr:2Fe-2S iron-sulfur cluster binding domain-containing protein [Rhodoferax sp.]MCX7239064.1 2Fe-2S iron-sulfur cluster binding domain-containing protein [Burkholderiales bacterium]
MTIHTVTLEDDGSSYRCSDTLTLLEGMESLGKKGIPAGCRGGGCGVCKVQVLSGSYTKRVMSREHVSEQEESKGCVLACRVRPTSAIALRVIGKMKKNVCRVVEPKDVLSPSQLENIQETTKWQ